MMVAFSRNIIYSAFSLLGAFGGVAGLYIFLGADFVAAFTIANNLGLPVVFPQNNNGVFVDSHDRQSILFVR